LKELSAKGQRTVYRLTLVKAFNTDEIENYAKLVSLGNPDFIEIKVNIHLVIWELSFRILHCIQSNFKILNKKSNT
jgi:wyosine [tRNA(Phe)-imidazoG37] synthetase (radical SAM superfamily)